MSNALIIPESLQFYFENEQQLSAVDQVITLKNPPTNLTLKEVEQYSIAKISVQSTQLDYWRLMKNLWQALVGTACKEVENHFYGIEYSIEYVWNNGFYRAYQYKNKHLFLFVSKNES